MPTIEKPHVTISLAGLVTFECDMYAIKNENVEITRFDTRIALPLHLGILGASEGSNWIALPVPTPGIASAQHMLIYKRFLDTRSPGVVIPERSFDVNNVSLALNVALYMGLSDIVFVPYTYLSRTSMIGSPFYKADYLDSVTLH